MKETKDEVIGILMKKMDPRRDEIFADIGCYTGKVSIEASKYFKKVYSVDIDEEAVKNVEKIKSENMEVFCMRGEDFLRNYTYDKVFIGGTKNYDQMLDVASKRAKKIIANVARLETASNIVKKMREVGIFEEMLLINISKSYELAGDTAFRPLNPIFMVIGSKRC
ncbi:MAG: putative cobalt-precorrin-6Y C(15)-methyltransferase [decarboxylating] [Candidatus Methanolliviera sp. GoM_oil]|nr:MAG: putative cobalt-precorrin-6Y C(15)-methyltransferase [decarboxylating] [Candidatus Methanolliviera sp. GoM_oil]